jgi:hypothetical protein
MSEPKGGKGAKIAPSHTDFQTFATDPLPTGLSQGAWDALESFHLLPKVVEVFSNAVECVLPAGDARLKEFVRRFICRKAIVDDLQCTAFFTGLHNKLSRHIHLEWRGTSLRFVFAVAEQQAPRRIDLLDRKCTNVFGIAFVLTPRRHPRSALLWRNDYPRSSPPFPNLRRRNEYPEHSFGINLERLLVNVMSCFHNYYGWYSSPVYRTREMVLSHPIKGK